VRHRTRLAVAWQDRAVLTVVVILGVVGILFGSAALATYEGQVLADPASFDRDPGLPDGAVQPEDVAELRFDMALRGYRMGEVDVVLARLAGELAARDSRIAQLEQALVAVVEPAVEEAEREQATGFVPVDGSGFDTPAWWTPEPTSADQSPADQGNLTPPPEPGSPASASVDPQELTATDDAAFGFPEVLAPDAADADLPDATEDRSAETWSTATTQVPVVLEEPTADEPAGEPASGEAPVGSYDQQQADVDDVPAPIADSPVETVDGVPAEPAAAEPTDEPDPEHEPEPPLGAPGEGAAPSGERAEGH
jgi:DivIVA domain-containing protein